MIVFSNKLLNIMLNKDIDVIIKKFNPQNLKTKHKSNNYLIYYNILIFVSI